MPLHEPHTYVRVHTHTHTDMLGSQRDLQPHETAAHGPFSAGTAQLWNMEHPLPTKDSQEGIIWQYSVPFWSPQELHFIVIG